MVYLYFFFYTHFLYQTIIFAGKLSWILKLIKQIIFQDSRLLLVLQQRKIAFLPKFSELPQNIKNPNLQNLLTKTAIDYFTSCKTIEECLLNIIYGQTKIIQPLKITVDDNFEEIGFIAGFQGFSRNPQNTNGSRKSAAYFTSFYDLVFL